MLKRITGFFLLLMVLLSFFLVSCSNPQKTEIPDPVGYVNDFAGMLSPGDADTLESILVQYEKDTSNEIAVVTVESLGGRSIQEYSIALAEKWRVGKAGVDNGIIILVAKQENEIRIEVGYGLEPYVTDAESKLIIIRGIIPFFKEEDYTRGIEFGIYAIMGTIDGNYIPSEALPPVESGGWPLWLIIVIILFGSSIGISFLGVLIGGRGSGYWSSGGFKFGGFGGGKFGGGGASGRW